MTFYAFKIQVLKKYIFLQDYSTNNYGIFGPIHGDTLTQITCANMMTHTTETPKSEIQVNLNFFRVFKRK